MLYYLFKPQSAPLFELSLTNSKKNFLVHLEFFISKWHLFIILQHWEDFIASYSGLKMSSLYSPVANCNCCWWIGLMYTGTLWAGSNRNCLPCFYILPHWWGSPLPLAEWSVVFVKVEECPLTKAFKTKLHS